MKRRTRTNELLVAAAFLLLTGFTCHHRMFTHRGPAVKTFFWTNHETGEGQRLYIDNRQAGELPYLPDAEATTGSKIVRERGLFIPLRPGSYSIFVRNEDGRIISRGTLYLRNTRNNQVVSSHWNNNNCKVQVVFGD